MTTNAPPTNTTRPRRTDAEVLARFREKGPPPGVSRLLGIELTGIDQTAGRVEASFRAGPELCNPIGTVQGGIITAMLDELMSVAAMAASHFTIVVPSLEIKTSFIRAARPGVLSGWGKVVRMGRNIAFLEGALHDAGGVLVATSTSTAMVQPRPQRSATKPTSNPG